MIALLVFILATLDIVFRRKKLLGAKGRFGTNVFKNPARYILPRIMSISFLLIMMTRSHRKVKFPLYR